MNLTLFAIQKAKSKEKPYRLADGDGLYLLVHPSGSKHWRFRYTFSGKENMLALGPFPAVGLADARKKRDEARKLLAEGKDPAQEKKLEKIATATAAANTFELVAKEYIAALEANGAAEATLSKIRWLLLDLAAPIGQRPVKDIKPAELLVLLQRIEKSGRRETARRLRGTIGRVFARIPSPRRIASRLTAAHAER